MRWAAIFAVTPLLLAAVWEAVQGLRQAKGRHVYWTSSALCAATAFTLVVTALS